MTETCGKGSRMKEGGFFSYFFGGEGCVQMCAGRTRGMSGKEEVRAGKAFLLPSLGAGGKDLYSSGPALGQSCCCGAMEMIWFRLRAAK